jgi:hypothetical protein
MKGITYFTNDKTGKQDPFKLMNGKWIPMDGLMPDDTSAAESVLIGAGKDTKDAITGIANLFGANIPKDQDEADAYGELKDEHPWATGTGETLSELAQMALPTSLASKGASVLKAGEKLAPLIGNVVGSAATAYAKEPEEGDTRLGNAITDAIGSLGGTAAAKLGGKLIYGAKKIPGVQEMLDRGVDMTADMASRGGSGFAAGIENLLSEFPSASSTYRKYRQQIASNWHKDAVAAAALPGTELRGTGKELVQSAKEGYQKAYQDIWGDVTANPNDIKVTLDNLNLASTMAAKQDDKAIIDKLAKSLEAKKNAIAASPGDHGRILDEMDKELTTAKLTATGEGRKWLTDQLTGAVKDWRGVLPQEIQTRLATIDQNFPKLLAVKRASKAAVLQNGEFQPHHLATASLSVGGPEGWIGGKAPLDDLIKAALPSVGKGSPETGAVRSFIGKVPGLPAGAARATSRLLLGQTAPQRYGQFVGNNIKKQLSDVGLQDLIQGGRVGAALTQDKDNRDPIEDLLKLFKR